MSFVQLNINLISSWITSHHLTINSKKNHIISSKTPSFVTKLLFLNYSQLECVSSFNYLGVIISPTYLIHASQYFDSLMFCVPCSHISASLNSFVPSTLSFWDFLPYSVQSSISLNSYIIKKFVY